MAKGLDVPKNMRAPHDLSSRTPGTAAWYYIEPVGLRIYASGMDAIYRGLITRKQLERALEIIKQEDKQR